MPRKASLFRLSMGDPGDVSAIEACLADGRLKPDAIAAILGKTEGNGCVNDFTRAYATQSLRAMLARYLEPHAVETVPLVMSGGTEGALSPHWIVIAAEKAEDAVTPGPALAIGTAITPPLSPSEIGRPAQAFRVRDAVRCAMARAEIDSPADVQFVQVKCPLLTAARAATVGGDVATVDMLKSMGLSRGASALGVGLALDELRDMPGDMIGADRSIWSSRASCSAGIELMACEVVVLGQSPGWCGPLRIASTVMADAIDAASVRSLLARVPGDPALAVRAVLAKAEASSNGMVRGQRHTMLEDSDISATRHARGFVGGVLAGLVGHTELFVSGGAEHQGPDGGGPVSIIYSLQASDLGT
ncbi:cyanuric acid amidohydrolase [Meridianimarinicoccus roseus]|uniref:Cyanuric acid amidohydrolase n=1 Tax=Meridianimarinicoccus roseus TaxID=2072018 RepID=A0A2V2LF54_9RHOB|nr:ring-opening amidohydrolase [Meridianimarinicoccus roseus]PWR04240.1 cyanuric acid amidohydrolase [Meridianimarinicoccus roseus]